MLRVVIDHCLACAFTVFCTINTIITVVLMSPLLLAKLLLNHTRHSPVLSTKLRGLASLWMWNNIFFLERYQKIEWDIEIPDDLAMDKSYLLISNHQTWVDIFVLFKIFLYKIPFPMFFIKQQLMWLPLIGIAMWGLDFPFMKRYSRSYLERHPEQRGKDLETTRKICEKFKTVPVAILNFLEGTRYTVAKAKRQNTPFRHLLLPRAGGVALVLATMGKYLDAYLNITITYSRPELNYWDFISGYSQKIAVRVEQMDIPQEFLQGDYQNDPVFQKKFQIWVNEKWHAKDELIHTLSKTF